MAHVRNGQLWAVTVNCGPHMLMKTHYNPPGQQRCSRAPHQKVAFEHHLGSRVKSRPPMPRPQQLGHENGFKVMGTLPQEEEEPMSDRLQAHHKAFVITWHLASVLGCLAPTVA
eukprot:5446790-Amphidinium_carterae.1